MSRVAWGALGQVRTGIMEVCLLFAEGVCCRARKMHQKQLICHHDYFKKGFLELFCDQMITNGDNCVMKVIALPQVQICGVRAQTSLYHVSFGTKDVTTANSNMPAGI